METGCPLSAGGQPDGPEFWPHFQIKCSPHLLISLAVNGTTVIIQRDQLIVVSTINLDKFIRDLGVVRRKWHKMQAAN